jgi:hypothetical protein
MMMNDELEKTGENRLLPNQGTEKCDENFGQKGCNTNK